jgi:hypothetical protein
MVDSFILFAFSVPRHWEEFSHQAKQRATQQATYRTICELVQRTLKIPKT